MNIDQELKKEGIEVIRTLDRLSINSIAKSVADKLERAFPEQNLSAKDLFMKLSRINMYVAKMPASLSSAKYYY